MTPAQEKSREIFFQGIEHFEAGRLAEARACFERCLALTPERPSVLGNLGITLFHLGERRGALPSNGEEELQLLPSLRYAHSEGYVRRLAAQCGLEVDDLRAAPIRHEQGRPVPGLYVTLRGRGPVA